MRQWMGIGLLLALLLSSCGFAGGDSQPKVIGVDEAYELYQNGTFFLDVRTQKEWDDYHAPNSVLIPLDQLQDRLDELPDGQLIVVICHSGNRSEMGRDLLLDAGFTQVTSMEGGLIEWIASGYPTTTGP